MKKIIFEISDILLDRMDEAVFKSGFHSRSEYLRFLIMTHSKSNAGGTANENVAVKMAGGERKGGETQADEFADVNLEYGIPVEVIEKIKRKAAILAENERRPQS